MAKREIQSLMDDLKQISTHAQDLCSTLQNDYSGRKASLVKRARLGYREMHEATLKRARTADRTIRSRPYEALGIAFVAGLIVGVLVTMEKKRSADLIA